MRHFPRILAVLLAAALTVPAAPAVAASNPGWSTLSRITTDADWARGADQGVRWSSGSLSIEKPIGRRWSAGLSYDYSQWTSAWVAPRRTFTKLVPSWNAVTPYGTWIQVFVRVRDAQGRVSSFKDLGHWSTRDDGYRRTSAGPQADTLARANVDTLEAQPGHAFTGYQFRVKLMKLDRHNTGRPAATTGPTLRALAAVASRVPASLPATSQPIRASRVLLDVPRFSQMTHQGQNPEYGGGGEAWCSPTSLAMVLGYYGRLPAPRTYAWVNDSYADPVVNHLARLTYDYGYRGTGNWPFNTAVAGTFIRDAFVTRLADLRMAERFVRARIPVIVSIKFGAGELRHAPISSTNGHLVVVVGFTRYGNPIVNDPAAPSNSTVLRSYNRAQFERAWIGGSGGVSYVVRDARRLPARPAGVRAW